MFTETAFISRQRLQILAQLEIYTSDFEANTFTKSCHALFRELHTFGILNESKIFI